MTTPPTLRDAAQAVLDALDECRFDIAANEALRAALAANPVEFDGIEALAAPADTTGLAHEIWAVAQLGPGEGIEDGVARIAALLPGASADALAEPVAWRYVSKEGFTQVFKDEPPPKFKTQCDPLYTATQLQQAVARAIEQAAQRVEALIADHVAGTQKSPNPEDHCRADDQSCEYVVAWRDAAAAIRAKGQQS